MGDNEKELTYEDDFFGVFQLYYEDQYIKEMSWLNEKINLFFDKDILTCRDSEFKTDLLSCMDATVKFVSMDSQLKTAKTLFQNQQDWDAKVRNYAVSEIFTRDNGWLWQWITQVDKELTYEEFASNMTLTSIVMSRFGGFRFHFMSLIYLPDSITVSGDLEHGLSEAEWDISGELIG